MRQAWIWLLIVAVAAAMPAFASPFIMRVLILAGIFVVLALSFDLVVGHTGQLSLAHPAFYGIGAYAIVILLFLQDW